MSPHSHFDHMAAGIASLPEGDPELLEARAHAATCVRCATALREAEEFMSMLDAVPAEMPSPEVLERVKLAVHAEMDRKPRFAWIHPLPAVVVAWAVFILTARNHSQNPNNWLVSVGVLVGSLLVTVLALRSGLAALALTLGATLLLTGTEGVSGGFYLEHGMKCLITELVGAAIPYGALVYMATQRRTFAPPLTFAAVAAAGALAGQAALQVTCPETEHLPHLFATHVAGVVLAAIFGVLGRGWFAQRAAA